jgi:hypothetical protein
MAVTNTKITAFEAEAEANQLLHGLLPDRFTAGDAWFDPTISAWRVPVVLAYPFIGPVGQVGEVLVSESAEQIISHTAADEMKTKARALYEQHREAIETAFSQTRDS